MELVPRPVKLIRLAGGCNERRLAENPENDGCAGGRHCLSNSAAASEAQLEPIRGRSLGGPRDRPAENMGYPWRSLRDLEGL
jgi:hypothetical protein